MISISGRKISQSEAISTMDSVLKTLEKRYEFLEHIQLRDTRFYEDNEMIHIAGDMNAVHSSDLGEAINDIVTTMYQVLGKNAGFFFIKELQKQLGEEYTEYIRDLGVDLGLLQLEAEVIQFRTLDNHR